MKFRSSHTEVMNSTRMLEPVYFLEEVAVFPLLSLQGVLERGGWIRSWQTEPQWLPRGEGIGKDITAQRGTEIFGDPKYCKNLESGWESKEWEAYFLSHCKHCKYLCNFLKKKLQCNA